ncbi:MAG: hypothetical protein WB608_01000 [Terracidiphilus sp.]
MHFNFGFSAVQVLWTLTFAAHLVLLVVLLGRDRIHRFPWFTTAIVLVTLRLLISRLLFGRLPQLTTSAIFIVLADLSSLVGLLVVVELARRAFARAPRRAWLAGTLVLLALGGLVVALWGKWPAWKTLAVNTPLAVLGLMQLVAQKSGLLVDVLTVALGLLVLLFGRRYGSGWRSHAQQIVIGLSTASMGQIAVQAIWQLIAKTAAPHSMAEYQRIVGLREKLFNANSAVYLLVLIWWIVCLWIDEPGTSSVAKDASVGEISHDDKAAFVPELPKETEE